jgi:hypothetical protein
MNLLEKIHGSYVYNRRVRVLTRELSALPPANARSRMSAAETTTSRTHAKGESERGQLAASMVPNGTNRARKPRLKQRLYYHRLRLRQRCMLPLAGGARVPIPTHLAAQVYSSGRRPS